MKCDKLKRKYSDITGPYYGYNEVNAAIDELRTSHHKERDEYISMVHSREQTIKELKAKLESVQASMYCDVVDANMENRRLCRTLWLARALRARDIQRWWIAATCAKITERACSVWNNVEHKCLKKAEEFK